MRLGSIILVLLAHHTCAQWSLGSTAFLHTDHRARQVKSGIFVRAELALNDRWKALAALGSSIPTKTAVDQISGGPRQLAAGSAIETRRKGHLYELDQFLVCGLRSAMGRIHRKTKKVVFHGGMDLVLMRDAFVWNMDVTVLASGEQYHSRGSNSYWPLGIAPVLGLRYGRTDKRLIAEIAPLVTCRSSERGAIWELRYALVLGYLWNLDS